MTSIEFQKIALSIPSSPGIYKYYDDKKILLYVGKAKNIRKRVSSYFNKTFKRLIGENPSNFKKKHLGY